MNFRHAPREVQIKEERKEEEEGEEEASLGRWTEEAKA